MTEEEKEFIKKVNTDKAKNKASMAIGCMVLSICTYIVPLIAGDFDFGIVFEGLTLILLINARKYMVKYELKQAKKYAILSMIPTGWIVIFDVITLLFDLLDVALIESITFVALGLIFSVIMDLDKAESPEKYPEGKNWFYEQYDGEKDDNNRNGGI